mmetsp:Transcript_38195/g.77787  ORF Transcript_38195/g.77787 Transcript_38195/m.77787 type:complete len:551 (+) Transcript_38195:1083-2735(+)
MSPLYGLTSWLSLVMPAYEGYLAVIKDFYEAYVIYQFLSLCIAILGKGDRDSVVDLLAQHADHLKPPFRLCGCCRPNPYRSPREMAEAVLIQCQTFTMQFVFLRPLTTIGIFVCNKVGYYGWGTSASDYRSPQFWLNMIQNLSVFIAFSGLLKFYHAVQEDLAWCRPFPKFLCIKGIVFLTFWQGLAIAILAETIGDTTPNVGNSDPELWAKQAQNFLICLEMLLFSIAHFYCFPTDEWEDGYRPVVSDSKFGDQLALHDFFQDLKLVARQGKKKKKKKKGKSKSSDENGNEKQAPENDAENGDGVASSEVASEGGLADASFDEEDLNIAQVESQIEGNLRSPDTPDDIRQASMRLLQAMAFETHYDDAPTSPLAAGTEDESPAREQLISGDEESGAVNVHDEDLTLFNLSKLISGDKESGAVNLHGEDEGESALQREETAGEVNEPVTGSSLAHDEMIAPVISDVDEDHHHQEEEEVVAVEEENNVMISYDDEESGLLGSNRNTSTHFGSAGDNDNNNGSGAVMGGSGDNTGSDGVLRPSLFTTLGKFS